MEIPFVESFDLFTSHSNLTRDWGLVGLRIDRAFGIFRGASVQLLSLCFRKHLKERFQVYAAYMLYSNLLAAWHRWCASLSLSFHKPLKITQKTAQLFAADPRTWLKHPRLASSQHKNHDTDDTSVLTVFSVADVELWITISNYGLDMFRRITVLVDLQLVEEICP